MYGCRKTIFVNTGCLIAAIALFHFYCGWSGNGGLFILGGFASFALIPLAVLFIVIFWIRKSRLKIWHFFILVPAYCIFVLVFTSFSARSGVSAGRYYYWRVNKRHLQSIAEEIFQEPAMAQIARVPSGTLGYPVFACPDVSEPDRFVVFSHWRTPALRDIGFIYCPQSNDERENMLKQYVEHFKPLDAEWYLYSCFKYWKFPNLMPDVLEYISPQERIQESRQTGDNK